MDNKGNAAQIRNSKIIYLLVLIYPLIDVSNGVFLNYLQVSVTPGELIRPLILIYFVYVYIQSSYEALMKLLMLVLVFAIAVYIQNLLGAFTPSDIKIIMKLFLNMVIFLLFAHLLQNDQLSAEKLLKTLLLSGSIISFSIIFAFLTGTSLSAYEAGIGVKGYFDSINAISAVLSMILPVGLIMLSAQSKTTRRRIVVFYLLLSLCLLLMGTKSGLAFALLTPAIYVTLTILFEIKMKSSRRLILALISGLSIIGIIIFVFFNSLVWGIVDRQLYFFSNRELTTYLFSTRNTGVKVIMDGFFGNLDVNVLNLFFGFGYENGLTHIQNNGGYTIEMDYFEIIHFYGIFVFCVFAVVLLITIYNGGRLALRFPNKNNWLLLVALVFGTVSSTFGGHVLTNGLAGLYLSTIMAIVVYYGRSNTGIRVRGIEGIEDKN